MLKLMFGFTEKIALIILILVLAACKGGSGGGGDDASAQPRPSGGVNGVAFDGLIIGGIIKTYAWADGVKGDALSGEARTNSLGEYSLSLSEVKSQPLLIEITGGRYIEEATGQSVPLQENERLYALINYTEGQDISTSITYYTTLATGHAEYLVRTGANVEDAIKTANDLISDQLGFDIRKVVPLDVTDTRNATPTLTDRHLYGFATAAISHLTKWISEQNSTTPNSIYNSIKFAQSAYDDIRGDGKLDGNGLNGLIAQGVVPLNEKIYRNSISLNMLVMANDPRNETSIKPSDIIATAKKFNESNASIYGGEPITPLSQSTPVLSNFSHTDNQLVAGTITFSFDATDTTGIKSVDILIDDNLYQSASDFNNLDFSIDTKTLTDDNHKVTILARNIVDGETRKDITLTVANDGIVITDMNPADGDYIRGTHTFSAKVADAFGVQSVAFVLDNTTQYNPLSLTSPTIELDTAAVGLNDGTHTFKADATNTNNFSRSKTTTFTVDNTNPSVTWGLSNDSYLKGTYNFAATVNDAIAMDKVKLFLDGDRLIEFTEFPNLAYALNTTAYTEGNKTLVLQAKDKAGNMVEINRAVTFDNKPPTISISTPFGGQVITSNFNVRANVNDSIGIAHVQVLIDNVHYAYAPNPNNPTVLVNVSGFSERNHRIKMIVTDHVGYTATDEITVQFQHIAPTLSFGAQKDVLEYLTGGSGRTFREYTINVDNTQSVASVSAVATSGLPAMIKKIKGKPTKVQILYTCFKFGSFITYDKHKPRNDTIWVTIIDNFGLSKNINISRRIIEDCVHNDD